jgi:hypothetical protein
MYAGRMPYCVDPQSGSRSRATFHYLGVDLNNRALLICRAMFEGPHITDTFPAMPSVVLDLAGYKCWHGPSWRLSQSQRSPGLDPSQLATLRVQGMQSVFALEPTRAQRALSGKGARMLGWRTTGASEARPAPRH